MIKLMDPIADKGYVVIYFHSGMDGKDKPDWSWMKKVYNIFDNKYSHIPII